MLDRLNGQRLRSVDDGQDYVVSLTAPPVERPSEHLARKYQRFEFDDYTLTVYNAIRLIAHPGVLDQQQPGFRDAIRELIQHRVSRVEYREGKSLEIEFDSAVTLAIGLQDYDYTGPEALMLRLRVDVTAAILVI